MNKGQGNPQFQCLPAPGPAIGSDVIVLLPQRPNEPDCIYYLRNGRCKYGSTCKFHHPLTYQSVNVGGMHDNMALVQQQHQDFTRRQTQRGRSFSTSDMNIVNNSSHMPIPLVASQSVLANQQHNQGHSGPTHILVPMLNPPLNKGNSSFHSNTNNSFLSHRSAPQGSITQPVSISSPIVSSSIASSYETASSFELIAASQGTSSTDNVGRWQRSTSQQPTSNFGNTLPTTGNNRIGPTPRQTPGSHYYVMTRTSSNDMLHSAEINGQSVSGTPVRHNQHNLMKFPNSSIENTRDRRAVSLGSSADVTLFSSLENNRQFASQSLQHGWESNNSLSTLSTRFREENNRYGSSPQRNNTFVLNNDATHNSHLYHDTNNNMLRKDFGKRFSDNFSQSSGRDQNDSLNFSDGHSRSLEEDGISTMTFALLNMLDTSEDLDNFNETQSKFPSDSRKAVVNPRRLSQPVRKIQIERPISGSGRLSELTTTSERNGLTRLHYSQPGNTSSVFSNEKMSISSFPLNNTNRKDPLLPQPVVAPQAAQSNFDVYLS